MARCETGYTCSVCKRQVEVITDSVLYLLYVLGDLPAEMLHRHPDRHLRCDPPLAQYVVDEAFPPVCCEGPFDKRTLDTEFVQAEEVRVTRAWHRLHALPGSGLTILDYPASGSY